MSTTIKFVALSPNKLGLSKIYIQVIHNRQIKRIPIPGLVLAPKDFANGEVKTKATSIQYPAVINKQISDYRSKALDVIRQIGESGQLDLMTIEKVSYIIDSELFKRVAKTKEIPSNTFTGLAEELINEANERKKWGTAKNYRGALSFMRKYTDKKNIYINEITAELLENIETKWFAEKNARHSVNGLRNNMRNVKAIINRAIRMKLLSRDAYPFNDYKIKSENSIKRSIQLEDIKKIANATYPVDSHEWHARNIFMFLFHCRGMNFVDFANLKMENIEDNVITYKRSKTRGKTVTIFRVDINEDVRQILDLYITNQKPNDFIFPIIDARKDSYAQYKDELYKLGFYDKVLNRMGKELGIRKITTYVARHSWASIAHNEANLSLDVISQALGHADLKTTQIYVSNFPRAIIDDASRKVSNLINDRP